MKNYTDTMRIGKAVHDIRLEKNISKNELCRLTGFNKGYVYRFENDLMSPTIASLITMGRAVKTPIWEIVQAAEFLDNATEYVQDDIGDTE